MTAKKAGPSQERADRRLYLRYRNDPERQQVAPVLARLAREGETPAKKGPSKKARDEKQRAAYRAYEQDPERRAVSEHLNRTSLDSEIVGDIKAERAAAYKKRGAMLEAQARAGAFNADELREELVEEAHRLRLLLTRLLSHTDHPADCSGCTDARAMLEIPEATTRYLVEMLDRAKAARVARRALVKRAGRTRRKD